MSDVQGLYIPPGTTRGEARALRDINELWTAAVMGWTIIDLSYARAVFDFSCWKLAQA